MQGENEIKRQEGEAMANRPAGERKGASAYPCLGSQVVQRAKAGSWWNEGEGDVGQVEKGGMIRGVKGCLGDKDRRQDPGCSNLLATWKKKLIESR